MSQAWITNSSTTVEAMVNSVNAACNQDFIPDHVYILETPAAEHAVSTALEFIETIIDAYDGQAPELHVTTLEDEVAFDQIRTHHKDAIQAATDRGDEVAVDITPGRKFMSAIAFAAGMQYDADQVFYFYLRSTSHYGGLYPQIPRTAARLYDFTEVG